jgi:anti-sigma factor RsiW
MHLALNDKDTESHELDDLFMKMVDGQLTPDRQLRLMERLRSDPAARACHARYLLVDAHLDWVLSSPLADADPASERARGCLFVMI